MKDLIRKHTELGWRIEFYYVKPHFIVRARKLDKKGEDTLFASIFKSGMGPRDAFLEANKWMTFQEEHGG